MHMMQNYEYIKLTVWIVQCGLAKKMKYLGISYISQITGQRWIPPTKGRWYHRRVASVSRRHDAHSDIIVTSLPGIGGWLPWT